MKKIEHKILNSVECKLCSKCGVWKSLVLFYKDKKACDGLYSQCKSCQKTSQKKYKESKPKNIKLSKQKWRKNNPEKVAALSRRWRINNSDKINKSKKRWRKLNTDKDAKWNSRWGKSFASYSTYADQLSYAEVVSAGETDELFVLCAYCAKKFRPTNSSVRRRIYTLNAVDGRENRFYCSENCKQACPIFNQSKYPKGFKKATSREVVPLLRQLVLERDNYTCQMCGATTEEAQLHVHHEKSYTLNKIMANDPDNCWTLCKECHKKVHSEYGCRYSDLKCSKYVV